MKEQILSLLGQNPSEQRITDVANVSKTPAPTIRQWLQSNSRQHETSDDEVEYLDEKQKPVQFTKPTQQPQSKQTKKLDKCISKFEKASQQPVSMEVYYLLKFQQNLIYQVTSLHSRIMKIIETQYDYSSLL